VPVDGVIVDGVTGDADVVVRLTTPVRLAMPSLGPGCAAYCQSRVDNNIYLAMNGPLEPGFA
jgi:hypothetical protein